MLALDTTIGTVGSNSYCTLKFANEYHQTHLYASTWEKAGDDKKTIALIMATRILDQMVSYSGIKASSTQALKWPRIGTVDEDNVAISSTIIPTRVQQATSEFARSLLVEDRTVDKATGLGSVKVDVIEIDYADAVTKKKVLPDVVIGMISELGVPSGGSQLRVSR